MLLLKFLLMLTGAGLLGGAFAIVIYDAYRTRQSWRQDQADATRPLPPGEIRWRLAGRLALVSMAPLVLGQSFVVVPSGRAGVLVSQISGTLPGALFPGVHCIVPLIQGVTLYDTREKVFTTALADDPKTKTESLKVQTKEGLPVGMAIAVRYRLDPRRLDYIHANLPQPIEEQIVPPVVAGVFRQVVPNYLVRDVFATRREEVRKLAADAIQKKLAEDGLLVKEVILRDIQLPTEDAKGRESLLLEEQESDSMAVEVEIKQKMVRTAELEAEAAKVRRVKQADFGGFGFEFCRAHHFLLDLYFYGHAIALLLLEQQALPALGVLRWKLDIAQDHFLHQQSILSQLFLNRIRRQLANLLSASGKHVANQVIWHHLAENARHHRRHDLLFNRLGQIGMDVIETPGIQTVA